MIDIDRLHQSFILGEDKTTVFVMDVLGNCFFRNPSSLYVVVDNTQYIKTLSGEFERLAPILGMRVKPVSFNTILIEFVDDDCKTIYNTIKFVLEKDTKGIKPEYIFRENEGSK